MLLDNKTILVTGASKGIGKAICELFAQEGARVILTGRNLDDLNRTVLCLKEHREGHLIFQMDVRKSNSIKAVFDQLKSNHIYLDSIVNNAGIMIDATLQMVKQEMLEEVYQTNVFGTILPTQFALKSFLKKRCGSVINLSSIIGTHGNLGQSIYGSSKTAIIGFTKSLSKELAPLNIRVNAIAPGFIITDLTKNLDKLSIEKTLKSIGMKRPGQPEDVAKVALFLASDLSTYVTGQVIGVDGGMII